LTKNPQKRIFVTDCEGPISKNDNAYELSSHFILRGDKFFSLISKYDDVLADVLKRDGYKAGDTLKLILPFLKAYGVTNQKIRNFSARGILLVAGAKDTMQFVQKIMPSYIVSTSYEHYISALCKTINFPLENTYSTKINIDKYAITTEEAETLKQIAKEIAAMPMIEIPKKAKSILDFSPLDQSLIRRLDKIFWSKIAQMSLGKIFDEVNPVGGREKAIAMQEIAARHGCGVDCVMYVGDSITDEESYRLVRNSDGLTVSFNGNEYAVREAEIAVMSENTIVTSILADVFFRLGKAAVLQLAEQWKLQTLKQYQVNPTLMKQAQQLYPVSLPKVEAIAQDNIERLAEESTAFRKKVRGEAIAKLG